MSPKNKPSSTIQDSKSSDVLSAAHLGFLGHYALNLDDKLRVTVPKRFKAALQQKVGNDSSAPITVVATIALDRHFRRIIVYPAAEWQGFYDQFKKSPVLDLKMQSLRGLISSLAVPCELDSQGRIRLDKRLVDLARIEKKVVATGHEDHFALWNPVKFEDFVEDTITHVDTMAQEVMTRQGSVLVGGASPSETDQ